MRTFEYHAERLIWWDNPRPEEVLEEYLNEMGHNGWELVERVSSRITNCGDLFIFKRETDAYFLASRPFKTSKEV